MQYSAHWTIFKVLPYTQKLRDAIHSSLMVFFVVSQTALRHEHMNEQKSK